MHFFLIIVYERDFSETEALKSLNSYALSEGIANFSVYIWDNSLKRCTKSSLLTSENSFPVEYFFPGSNTSLSEVYNTVLDKIFLKRNGKSVTILDQDSHLDQNFIKNCLSYNGNLLCVPKVISNKSGKIISPRYQVHNNLKRSTVKKYISLEEIGNISSKNFFAIGSGLTITKHVWDNLIRFDEKLSFYGVDEEFCNDYSLIFNEFFLLDGVLLHDISDESVGEIGHDFWRFKKYMQHWRYRLVKYNSFPIWSSYIVYFYWIIKFKIKRALNYDL